MGIVTQPFGKGLLAMLKNDVDWEAITPYLSLHTSTYTPNADTQDFADDLTNELANGSGYTTDGVALTSPALSYDAATDQVRFTHDAPSWTFSASKTWRYGVIKNKRGGAASADELLFLLTWDSDQTVSTPYTLNLPAEGLYGIDVTPS